MNLSLLDGTENTRDLGRHTTRDGRVTRSLSLLRSDIPKNLSERDIAFLRNAGITEIVDMREEASQRREQSTPESLEGFTVRHCPIPEGAGIPESPAALPGSYMVIAESEGMRAAFHAIAGAERGVLYHCNAGKDRTGVVSAVLLSLVGVPEEEIIADYVLTAECIKERLRNMHERFPQIDMTVVTPCEDYMRGFLTLWKAKYGCAENYLHSLGLTEEEVQRLREKLL